MSAFSDDELWRAELRGQAMASPPERLRAALQQAEGYRNFLATLTGLLTVIFVLKGQENLSRMTTGPRWWVTGLLAGAFLLLLLASWMLVSAVHERPGAEVLTDGEVLLRYETERADAVVRTTGRARWMGLVGVLAVTAASLITWIYPGQVA
ncbi:hypothetical protein AB0G79_16945 [Streptomyces sp. NPDC020807]|uniref:hypothetical protein n=1 Tax=Streptomyces sp. NPDC020807 TaxID=3155119 RepID=UPI0033F7EC59